MGWTYINRPYRQPIRETLAQEFNYTRQRSGVTTEGRVIDCAVVDRTTAYVAYETKVTKPDGQVERNVFAIIVLLKYPRGYYNFAYKDMLEDSGPYEDRCPRRILEQLTPTQNSYAQQWRANCWARLAEKEDRP